MKKILNKALIFGVSDFSELILRHLLKSPDAPEIAAFVLDREYKSASSFAGLPLIAADEMAAQYPPDIFAIYNCLGYKRMNEGRALLHKRLIKAGYDILSYIHPTVQLECNNMGVGTIALANVVIDCHSLGDGNIFQIGAMVAHHSCIGDFNFFAPSACVTGQVKIANRCFFGANSTVRNGLNIADKTLVGAAAYVCQDTKEDSVIVSPKSVCLDKSSLDIL